MEQHSPEQAAIYSGDLPVPKDSPDRGPMTTLIEARVDLFGSLGIEIEPIDASSDPTAA